MVFVRISLNIIVICLVRLALLASRIFAKNHFTRESLGDRNRGEWSNVAHIESYGYVLNIFTYSEDYEEMHSVALFAFVKT